MEKLSHLINSAIEVGQWRPVRASGSSPFISHLFFADDLILVAKASCEQAKFLKRCLDLFCELSGQEVSSLQVFGWHGKIRRICVSALTFILGKYFWHASKVTYDPLKE